VRFLLEPIGAHRLPFAWVEGTLDAHEHADSVEQLMGDSH
jgi:hypothetical protein